VTFTMCFFKLAWRGSRREEPGEGGHGRGGDVPEPPAGARGERRQHPRGGCHRLRLEHQVEHVLGGVRRVAVQVAFEKQRLESIFSR
jgi:hypothetical protein